MAKEDYTTYTAFDPDAVGYAIDSSVKVSGTTILTDWKAMIFKDIGAGAFPANVDFTHSNSFKLVGLGNFPCQYVCSNTSIVDRTVTRSQTPNESLGQLGGVAGDCVATLMSGAGAFIDSIVGGIRSFLSIGNLASNTEYWADYIYDATAQTFTTNIYSDEAKTTLVRTGTRSHVTVNDKQWITALGDFGLASGVNGWSAECYDLDLGIAPPVSNAIPPHVFARVR